jgi:hypothetical protein
MHHAFARAKLETRRPMALDAGAWPVERVDARQRATWFRHGPLDLSPIGEGTVQRGHVRVLELATNRHAGRNARHADTERLK